MMLAETSLQQIMYEKRPEAVAAKRYLGNPN
jgi:hypothetical protein